jgi:hypothetical protein
MTHPALTRPPVAAPPKAAPICRRCSGVCISPSTVVSVALPGARPETALLCDDCSRLISAWFFRPHR